MSSSFSPEAVASPSVVLRGFHGGIVNNPDVALRLGQIILESLIGPKKLAVYLPLRAEDREDRWKIVSPNSSISWDWAIEIRKLDAALVSLGANSRPSALATALIADKFTAALLENERGRDELRQQLPFAITDNGGTWSVRGNRNADRSVEGPGPFHIEVQKHNAQVLDIAFEWVLDTPCKVRELLRRSAQQP